MSLDPRPDPADDLPVEESLGDMHFTPEYCSLLLRLQERGTLIESLKEGGDDARVLEVAQEAIELVTSSNNFHLDDELTGLKMQFLIDGGEALANLGRPSEARIYFEDAMRLAEGDEILSTRYSQGIICFLGSVQRSLGDYASAIECFSRAVIIGGEMTTEACSELIITHCMQGDALLMENKDDDARAAFEAACGVSGARSGEASEALSSATFQLGDIALARKLPDRAVEWYRRSIECARQSDSMLSSHVRSIEVEAAECLLRGGELPRAINFVRPLVDVARRLEWNLPIDEYEHFVRAGIIFSIILVGIGEDKKGIELFVSIVDAVGKRIEDESFLSNQTATPLPAYFAASYEDALAALGDRAGRRAARLLRDFAP